MLSNVFVPVNYFLVNFFKIKLSLALSNVFVLVNYFFTISSLNLIFPGNTVLALEISNCFLIDFFLFHNINQQIPVTNINPQLKFSDVFNFIRINSTTLTQYETQVIYFLHHFFLKYTTIIDNWQFNTPWVFSLFHCFIIHNLVLIGIL